MRIGIFGGSFNPPHKMHKRIAFDLIKMNYVDKIIYVPTGNKYNKKGLLEAQHRLNMLNLMIKDKPSLSVSDYELKEKLTYTYETLDYFKNEFKNDEIYFICGSDNLKEITTWKEYQYILDNYKILVIKRNSDDIDSILKELNHKNIIIACINSCDLSSSLIRKNIKEDIDITDVIDSSVYQYIKEKKLYS